jgi:hypothetical protein
MKPYKIAVLFAAAAGSFAGMDASAQFNYTPGDLMLGFRTPGTGNDMVVDIGSASSLVAAATSGGGSTLISGTFYTGAQFTASGLNFNNLYFSVFGDSSANTLWVTGVSPLNEHTGNSQSIAGGQFEAIASGASDYPGYYANNAANSANVTIMPNSLNVGGGSDLSYTQGIKNPNTGASDFGYFPVINEANTVAGFSSSPYVAAINLYELDPHSGSTTPGTRLGYFELGNDGVMTFNLGVAPVPEPGTWAVLGSGLLALVAARRMKTKNNF